MSDERLTFDMNGPIPWTDIPVLRRRVAACVNACQGIPTAALEEGTLGEFMWLVAGILKNLHAGVTPEDSARLAEQMLRELGRLG